MLIFYILLRIYKTIDDIIYINIVQIPADMVVNAILAAMAAHANQPGEVIYQVGSSMRNPLRYSNLHDYGFRFFTKKPWINKDGTPVKVGKVTVMGSMASFHRYMTVRYLLFLKVIGSTYCFACINNFFQS